MTYSSLVSVELMAIRAFGTKRLPPNSTRLLAVDEPFSSAWMIAASASSRDGT